MIEIMIIILINIIVVIFDFHWIYDEIYMIKIKIMIT